MKKVTVLVSVLLCVGSLMAAVVPVNDAWIQAGAEKTMTADNIYVLQGLVFVEEGAVLNIQPGTVIKAQPGATALIIARGGRIYAEGTADEPIIFTAFGDDPTVLDEWDKEHYLDFGLWGGVILLGRATHNRTEDELQIEGIPTTEPRARFGGNDDDDTSGVLRYVSIRFGGYELGANNEINGLTFGAVGRGTVIDHVEVYSNQDDGFEWFGGTVNSKYLVSAGCGDDAFDWDEGFRGRGQYWYAQQLGGKGRADYCGEFDGGQSLGEPYTIPVVANATFVGNGSNILLNIRENTGGKFYNCYFTKCESGIEIEDENDPAVQDCRKRVEAGDLFIKNSVFWNMGLGVGLNKWYSQEDPPNGIAKNAQWFAESLQVPWANKISDEKVARMGNRPGWLRVHRFGDIVEYEDGIDPRPTGLGDFVSSIAYTEHVNADGSGFLEKAKFKGAFDPAKKLWLWGWTALSDYGFLDSTYIDSVFFTEPGVGAMAAGDGARRNVSVTFGGGRRTPFVRYHVTDDGYCSVRLYAANGAVAATLVEGSVSAGEHVVRLSDARVTGGMYICEVRTPAGVGRTRVILQR